MRHGISNSVVVGIIVVVVVGGALGAYFAFAGGGGATTPGSTTTSRSTTTPGSTTTSSTSRNTSSTLTFDVNAVKNDFNNFLADLNSRNVQGMIQFYVQNKCDHDVPVQCASVSWTAASSAVAVGGQTGVYNGTGNIQLLYSTTVSNADRIHVSASNVQAVATASGVTVTYSLNMTGHAGPLGNFNGTIQGTDQWVLVGGNYLITKGHWHYSTFVSQNELSATVFPQWGLTFAGKSPDLASEHVLEWRTAPILAIVLYVSILGVALVALLIRRPIRNG